MKKKTTIKILSAVFVMAVSMLIAPLQAQDVTLEFVMDPNGPEAGVGSDGTGGIGGDGPSSSPDFVEQEDPRVELNFSIGPTGQIELDAYTPATVQAVIDAVDYWDNAAIGSTTNPDLYGKSFQLIMKGESRMQLGFNGGDGVGIRGKNQGRIDDVGEFTEWLRFELTGDVGIDFTELGYTNVGGPFIPHLIIKDHDTDMLWDIPDESDPEYIDGAEYNMRYFSDILEFTTADTGANGGYRVYSLAFDVVAPQPKPPAVLETSPVHADTTVETTDDYVILFDVPVDAASAASAITFTPDVSNRADSWNNDGDELTISFDELPYATDFTVSLSTDLQGTNGLNMLADTTFTFKTLPEPPTIDYTFPANLATGVPVTTPFEIRFSKGMRTDSVEKAIEFTPAATGLDFIWNEDNSTVYFVTDELTPNTQYFVTVNTVATDRFGVQLASPFQYLFTTAAAVGVDNNNLPEMVVYPNPADEMLSIRGIDVQSVTMYNTTGQLVKQVSNKSTLNVRDFKPGIYVINVEDRDENSYREVILIK